MITEALLARLEVLYVTTPSILTCELRENNLLNFGFQTLIEFALVLAASFEIPQRNDTRSKGRIQEQGHSTLSTFQDHHMQMCDKTSALRLGDRHL